MSEGKRGERGSSEPRGSRGPRSDERESIVHYHNFCTSATWKLQPRTADRCLAYPLFLADPLSLATFSPPPPSQGALLPSFPEGTPTTLFLRPRKTSSLELLEAIARRSHRRIARQSWNSRLPPPHVFFCPFIETW